MGDTSIEWTDKSWNPLTGCTKVSPGCDHCYAKTMHERFHGPGSFDTVTLHPERLRQPLSWRKPSRVFVNSMSDLFHQDVPDDYIARVFGTMASAAGHTYQLLTKRHARLRSLLSSEAFVEDAHGYWADLLTVGPSRQSQFWTWPLPNVWLGVSVESQQWADIRIPALLDTPAAVRFLSCEPLLGPIDLDNCGGYQAVITPAERATGRRLGYPDLTHIDWVIVGGESGPGARPMHPDWSRSLRDQCAAADVPFLFKQWGEWRPYQTGDDPSRGRLWEGHPGDALVSMIRVGKKRAGRELDGRTWDEFPGAGR